MTALQAAEHSTSQQVAWAERIRLGLGGKELKIAAKEYQFIHGLLMPQILVAFHGLRQKAKDLSQP